MSTYRILAIGIVILVLLFLSIRPVYTPELVAHYAPLSQKYWWQRPGAALFGYPYYSYWESFANPTKPAVNSDFDIQKNSPLVEFLPNGPGPSDLYNHQPYHLLNDEMAPPRLNETISCVNSRSCYATNFERMVDKTGNFRQMTNNYKRNYPDSCSSPYQELVLNFYKADPMAIPSDNTGKSVSEAN